MIFVNELTIYSRTEEIDGNCSMMFVNKLSIYSRREEIDGNCSMIRSYVEVKIIELVGD
jgi:hypothetical protein